MKTVLIVLAVSLFALTVSAEETTTQPTTPSNATEASTTNSATTPSASTKEEKVTCADKEGQECAKDQKPSASTQTPKQD